MPERYREAGGAQGNGRQKAVSVRRRVLWPGRVTEKIRAEDVELGHRILLTQDPDNTAAQHLPGPWYPALDKGPDTVAARVRGTSELTRRGQHFIGLVTSAGELNDLSPAQSIIPVGED